MPFQYKKVLVLGATSGIGEALAAKLVREGSSVIVTGRRKEKLEAFVQEHGEKAAAAMEFDITELAKIPEFVSTSVIPPFPSHRIFLPSNFFFTAHTHTPPPFPPSHHSLAEIKVSSTKSVTQAHPDLDCVVLNSGIQRGFDFAKPESVDLAMLETELNTNYLSYIHFVTAILPFLQAKKDDDTGSALILMSSGLAMVPLPRCPNYCATKAALHQFALSLREQLRAGPVKVIEVFPPAVQSKLSHTVLTVAPTLSLSPWFLFSVLVPGMLLPRGLDFVGQG